MSHQKPCLRQLDVSICAWIRQTAVVCRQPHLKGSSLSLGGQVRDYTSWVASIHQELQTEECSWEPSSSLLRLRAHQWLRAELEAREELQQQAAKLGQQALLAAGIPTKEVGTFPMLPAYPVLLWTVSFPPTPTSSPRLLWGSTSSRPQPHLSTFSSSGPGWASSPTEGT